MHTSARQTYIDWLRFGAIAAVLFFHSAMPFTDEFCQVKNARQSQVLNEMVIWLHRFRMPLLFFISGTVSWFMLQNKSAGGFVRLRLRRLFIPLLFGILVIVPPQIYIERIQAGYQGSFLSFYLTVFTTGVYPNGNLSWNHLWFFAYLLVYDIALAPVLKYLVTDKGKILIEKFNWFAEQKRIYYLILPGTLFYALFAQTYPQTLDLVHDYVFLPYWLLYLLAGFVCIGNDRLMDSLQRNRRFSLGISIFSALFLNALRWSQAVPDNSKWHYGLRALSVVCAWTSVFAAVGYGKKYFTRRTPFLNYSNQAIYPFYILHQTVLIWLAYYVVRFPDSVALKYLYLFVMTLVITVAIYHLIIRPVPVLRFLFGMRGRGNDEQAGEVLTADPRRLNKRHSDVLS